MVKCTRDTNSTGHIQTLNNMFNSLFSDMQHYNTARSMAYDREPSRSYQHPHEELVLQGRMTVSKNGTSFFLQGPHDILMAQAVVVTPAGIHHLRLNEGARCFGTFMKWDKDSNPPNREQKHLLHSWDMDHADGPQRCRRKHRTVREAVSCSGCPKPVMELSDPPRRGPHRPTGDIQRALHRRRHTPQRRPVPIVPKPSGHIFHFKPSRQSTATVQVHPPPKEMQCPIHGFFQPGPEAIHVVKAEARAGPKAEPQPTESPALLSPETVRILDGVRAEMGKHLGDMKTMVENSKLLMDRYLCHRDNRTKQQKWLDEKQRILDMGFMEAQPYHEREQAPPPKSSPAAAARQDPAILEIQPTIPTPPSTPSSLPSLVTVSNHEDSDSDCIITSYTPPRRKAQVKREPVDPVHQLTAGAENLLL